MIFSELLLRDQPLGFGSLVCNRRGFWAGGSRCSTSRLALLLPSLTIGSLAIRTWWVRDVQTLRRLIVLVLPMKIPLQVFHISNFDRFCIDINVLILLSKIGIYFRFCLTSIQASFGMILGPSYFNSRWF